MAEKEEKEKVNQKQPEVEVNIGGDSPEPKETETPEMPTEMPKENETPAEPEGEMTEEPVPEKPKEPGVQEKLAEIVKRFNPEADVSSPEMVMEGLLPVVTSVLSFHDDLSQVVDEFPEFGDFLIGLRKGMSPQEAYARYIEDENYQVPEGAPDYEKLETARGERRKMLGERKARKQRYADNEEVSAQNLIDVSQELGLDDKTAENVGVLMGEIITDFMEDGLIKKENWMKLANGLRHEAVVAEKDKEMVTAVEDAKIAGRNEQIEKKRAGKETGDGLPKMTSTGSSANTSKTRKSLVPERKEFRV